MLESNSHRAGATIPLAILERREGQQSDCTQAIPAYGCDGNSVVLGAPLEVQNLREIPPASMGFPPILTWDRTPPAASYNVYRAGGGSLIDLSCNLSGLADTSAPISEVPASGRLFAYLVTAKNCNGESPLGSASSGSARTKTSPFP